MSSKEKPIGTALVICDQVIIEAKTDKKTLVGTFNAIFSKQFPCVHPKMSIYVAITNGKGTVESELRCVNESANNQLVFRAEGSIPFENPNQIVEINFDLNAVTFEKPGLHSLDFLCDGEIVLQRRFQVNLLNPKA